MMWQDMTALKLGGEIAAGAIDPVDLAEHFLERIASLDADGRIFIRLVQDRTRAEARAVYPSATASCCSAPPRLAPSSSARPT